MKNKRYFYVLGYDDGPEGGIYRYSFSKDEGLVMHGFTQLAGANFACISPNGKYLYSTCRINGEGGAAAFKIEKNGDLTFLNMRETDGRAACHVEISPDGKVLFVANYLTGNLVGFKLTRNGLGKSCFFENRHEGHGPNKERQQSAHVHMCKLTPDNKRLAVMDLGIDTIVSYGLTDKWRTDVKNIVCSDITPHGSGPRHIVFTSAGNRAYLVNELFNTVMALDYNQETGAFTIAQTVSMLPSTFKKYSKAAAIRLSPDEKYVYASNRGHDSVAIFKISQTGKLTRTGIVSSGGVSPRDFEFLADGQHLIMTNEDTDNIIVYEWNSENGNLTPTEWTARVKHPLNVVNMQLP